MPTSLVVCALLPGIAAVTVGTSHMEGVFHSYVHENKREYRSGTEEYDRRFAIFLRRFEEVEAHNAQPDRIWNAGINNLSDLTEEEMNMRFGWRHTDGPKGSDRTDGNGGSLLQVDGADLPTQVNWRKLKMGSKVFDQGACGSCWAVTAATILEAHSEILKKTEKTFSPQELIDCVSNPLACGGKGGCEGATVELAYDWVKHRGLSTEMESPYTGHASIGSCQKPLFRKAANETGPLNADGNLEGFPDIHDEFSKKYVGFFDFKVLPKNDYTALMRAATQGPVAVSVAASSWHMYKDGIFDGCKGDVTLNHAVSLFGYGENKLLGINFWLVKNSWGEQWGEQGYIRILRHHEEEQQCAFDSKPEEGVQCKGGPSKVKVCGTCGILYDSVVPIMSSSSKSTIVLASDGSLFPALVRRQ